MGKTVNLTDLIEVDSLDDLHPFRRFDLGGDVAVFAFCVFD